MYVYIYTYIYIVYTYSIYVYTYCNMLHKMYEGLSQLIQREGEIKEGFPEKGAFQTSFDKPIGFPPAPTICPSK